MAALAGRVLLEVAQAKLRSEQRAIPGVENSAARAAGRRPRRIAATALRKLTALMAYIKTVPANSTGKSCDIRSMNEVRQSPILNS
jgi:hypothetical protein